MSTTISANEGDRCRNEEKMATSHHNEQLVFTKDIWSMLKKWDDGSSAHRMTMLSRLVKDMHKHQHRQIELLLQQGASLLLARILAWLQVSVSSVEVELRPLFRTLGVFLDDVEAERFAAEMVEGAGVLNFLQVVSKGSVADACHAVRLLRKICALGRRWKEALCQSYAVKALCERGSRIRVDLNHHPDLHRKRRRDGREMCKSEDGEEEEEEDDEEDQLEETALLLQDLCRCNLTFKQQLGRSMITLLTSSSGTAHWLGCKGLCALLPYYSEFADSVGAAFPALVPSRFPRIQKEAVHLLLVMLQLPDKTAAHDLLAALVKLMVVKSLSSLEPPPPLYLTEPDLSGMETASSGPLRAFRLQANAAMLLGKLLQETAQGEPREQLAQVLADRGMLDGLLYALANSAHPDSQLWACRALRTMACAHQPSAHALQNLLPEHILLLQEDGQPELAAQEFTALLVQQLLPEYKPRCEEPPPQPLHPPAGTRSDTKLAAAARKTHVSIAPLPERSLSSIE